MDCELLHNPNVTRVTSVRLQTEYERKVEAACNVAFKNEEKDVQTMQDINNILIENILPSCVAANFLSPTRNTQVTIKQV